MHDLQAAFDTILETRVVPTWTQDYKIFFLPDVLLLIIVHRIYAVEVIVHA